MRNTRRTFVTALFVAALAAAVAPVPSAHAQTPPDTAGILTPWRIEPPIPCVEDSVFMIVRGFVATACDSFLGAEAVNPLFVRIRLQTWGDRDCPAPPNQFYPVPVALGRFPDGPQRGIVEVELTTAFSTGPPTVSTQQYPFEFDVDSACAGPPPPPPPGPLPYVHSIGTDPERPCAGRPTSLVLSGVFRDGCGRVIDSYVHDPSHVELTLKPDVLPDTACTLNLQPWRVAFDLGQLPSGPHRTNITLHVITLDTTRTGFVRNTYYGSHEFFVFGDCDSTPPPPPPPPPGPLPYVSEILVTGPEPCDPRNICDDDSIRVTVMGAFPSNCFSFRRVELVPFVESTLLPPSPPIVRFIVDDGACLGMPCINQPVPWTASAMLPPQLAGRYALQVELAEVSCSDTYPPGKLYRTEVPLVVRDSCPPEQVCLTPDWEPGPGGSVCNAFLSKTQPAELTFLIRSGVALAGLQGEFRLDPAIPRIVRIEAIGHAAGMLLEWTPTDQGARFVLLAPSGAPIPAWIATVVGGGHPILKVQVQLLARVPAPAVTIVTTENLLGSDIAGNAVPLCPPLPCLDIRVPPGRAVICGEQACDFNADGVQDVRDLVLMIHCVNGEGPCPPDAGTRFDCDGDASFGIPDVICCAHTILQSPSCPDPPCPPDTGGTRPEPRIAVRFDPAVESASGVDLPVRIAGLNLIGAAMLTLDLPLDRYEVTGYDVTPPGNWLTLHEVRDGRAVLGMLDVRGGNQPAVLDPARFTLHLRLRPGAAPGGQVTAVAGRFSGPDGVSLQVDLGSPTQTLPGGTVSGLSPSHPNPFSVETRFTLQLDAPADVVVRIFDLRGRAVATLHRGPLAAGPREFTWDGRTSEGNAAPDGVYFYHAAIGAKTLARKLVLMRRE